MGHYDDIRDAREAEHAKERRRKAVYEACRDLMRAMGMVAAPTHDVLLLLILKTNAFKRVSELNKAMEKANKAIDDLLLHDEVTITQKKD